jgi:ubiquitin carboxyl-terminal hydrolase 9/13
MPKWLHLRANSYCNSIVQALFYTEPFRDEVVSYPQLSPSDTPNGVRPKVNVTIRPPMNGNATTAAAKSKQPPGTSEAIKRRQAMAAGVTQPGQPGLRPEDRPDSPEYKKKQAMIKGPILELAQEHVDAYGMAECSFTSLKDLFLALIESTTRTGVLSPQRFLEIFKEKNDFFRNSMHQDAHEFYGLLLNDIINNLENNAKVVAAREEARKKDGLTESVAAALGAANLKQVVPSGAQSPGISWVHNIFEGVLTSETKCLTCETTSQRDETFLDLSIDLEEHSSVTSCLRKFSAEEMLCERNKFHCDNCGGLQEAEKRMKLKRLPKVLALHLKRFKWTEDYSRLQKLFHRVVYPYHLRMFNTTDDAEDADRMYELYAVVVHIGGNAYHGHYVSVIKTKDRGWVLFDDEMVEPVDKHFVRNFFGDKPGMACAYVLFYRETTFENVQAEYEADGLEEVKMAGLTADVAHENGQVKDANGAPPLKQAITQPVSPVEERDTFASLAHAQTAPAPIGAPAPPANAEVPSVPALSTPATPATPAQIPRVDSMKPDSKSKEDKKREKKEQEAAEKARKQAEKDKAKADEKARKENAAKQKQEEDAMKKVLAESKKTAAEEEETRKSDVGGSGSGGFLSRSNRGSKSMSRKSFGFLSKDKTDGQAGEAVQNGDGAAPPSTEKHDKLKERFSFGIGRKKSSNVLS